MKKIQLALILIFLLGGCIRHEDDFCVNGCPVFREKCVKDQITRSGEKISQYCIDRT